MDLNYQDCHSCGHLENLIGLLMMWMLCLLVLSRELIAEELWVLDGLHIPQLEILGHQSIGGSLFHSGWGSVIETLQFGHCLVVLPLIIDQPLNARLLVDKGLAVEVERREDGSFTRDDIANALRLAMVSEEGEKLRVRAREAAVVFKDRKLHENYFQRFVDYLKLNVVKKRKVRIIHGKENGNSLIFHFLCEN
ncbi:hypothetical protein Dsin_007711 [Dipteronia sinensis]|uniref:Uncharacterized protein n=1 Tax=Dipteronia sinensis TaxID=43782 RepID=A0AAE0B1Z9_9ROSI|nr:hypothetical protein Dsin_007711 [Dipteronia sinensis]